MIFWNQTRAVKRNDKKKKKHQGAQIISSCIWKISMRSYRGNTWTHCIYRYIDFNEGLFNISTKRHRLLQIAFEKLLSIFLLSHFDTHASFSQTVNLPCHSTAAQPSHFWHKQPQWRQQSCQYKETWNQIHQMFTPKVFMGRILRGNSSLERWWVCKHSHQLHGSLGHSIHTHNLHPPHFGQKRRFALCGLSLPSHLSSPFTTTEGCSLSDRSVTCGSAPPRRIVCPSNPAQRGQLRLCHPTHAGLWAPGVAARLRLCEHTLCTWPIILAMSPTSVQLQQSWIGPCSCSETATAYS